MRITRKMVPEILEALDEVWKDLSEEYKQREEDYPFGEWERKRKEVKERLRKLPEFVREVASMLEVERPERGRPQKLRPEQKTMPFLFARIADKINRDMEALLALLGPVFGVEVSYKTIERLYSDEEVKLVLHNLFLLLLEEEGMSGKLSGDGTGYSFSVEKHYRSSPTKKGKDYCYAFRLLDLKTGMYVAYGCSHRSEMEAFRRGKDLMDKLGVPANSVSLDKYYSSRKVMKLFGKETELFLIPKKNLKKIGFEWYRVLNRFLEDPVAFLKRYFRRNLFESGFSSDKRRFGQLIRQKREADARPPCFLSRYFTTYSSPRWTLDEFCPKALADFPVLGRVLEGGVVTSHL